MSQPNEILRNHTTRVRQLILRMREVAEANSRLQDIINDKDSEINSLKQTVEQLTSDYNHLKTARMMEITYGDIDSAKARITKLITDVNKSLVILGDD